MKRISLTNRLTFLFAHASAAMLLGLGLLISHLVERHFDELDVDALSGKLQLAQSILANARTRAELDGVPAKLNTAMVGHPGLALVVFWPDGKTLLSSSGADFPRSMLERMPLDTQIASAPAHSISEDGRPYLRMSVRAQLGVDGVPPAILHVALDTYHHKHFIDRFQTGLWLIVVVAAILNGFLGRLAVQRGLAPLRLINREAQEMTASRLHQRLDGETIPVELAELVQSLNTMLGRLEEAFQRLSDFSSDLAHELRTPVSNMLMQTQVTLSKARSAEEYREILYSNAEEFARLSRMISDMLFLAKADHGLVKPFKEVVDLAEEVRELFSFFEVLAESKRVTLHLEGTGWICGDRMLLRRAFSNLLSNAIRHTPEAGVVRVKIDAVHAGTDLVVGIENTGEPIMPEHLPRLFDRFYRVDAARAASSEGAGLGLAITKSIISLHSGTIRVTSNSSRTRFELLLPHCHHLGDCKSQRQNSPAV